MTDATEQELIRTIPQIVIAVGVLAGTVFSFLNGRKLNRVHEDVNGKMEKLISVSVSKAHAEGVLEEKERS